MNKKKFWHYIKWLLGLTSILVSIILFQSLGFKKITSKVNQESIRIGYLNLNKTAISEVDLQDMNMYHCDLWLFLEWNGNNFDNHKNFTEPYKKAYEIVDTFTYGFLVLAKPELVIQAKEFDQENRPYTCDYPKLLIELQNMEIGFLHAPPPVPTCNYETKEYINDALKAIDLNLKNQILIGDFNATILSGSYKNVLRNGFTDAFRGDGYFKGTFGFKPHLPKWLRIDYCFTKGNIGVVNTWRMPSQNSDHCGLIVDLIIEN